MLERNCSVLLNCKVHMLKVLDTPPPPRGKSLPCKVHPTVKKDFIVHMLLDIPPAENPSRLPLFLCLPSLYVSFSLYRWPQEASMMGRRPWGLSSSQLAETAVDTTAGAITAVAITAGATTAVNYHSSKLPQQLSTTAVSYHSCSYHSNKTTTAVSYHSCSYHCCKLPQL